MYQAMTKIKQLREEGWKVHIRMARPTVEADDDWGAEELKARHERVPGDVPLPSGGITSVSLQPPDGGSQVVGEAHCHPEKDNFNNKIGLEIAFGRAWKKYEDTRVSVSS